MLTTVLHAEQTNSFLFLFLCSTETFEMNEKQKTTFAKDFYAEPLYLTPTRLYFYEVSNKYLGIIMSLVYIMTAAFQFAFEEPYPLLMLIPALLTNIPHFFRHHFDYIPNLFSQVYYCWICLIHSLTMAHFKLPILYDTGESRISTFVGLMFPLHSLIQLLLTYMSRQLFNFLYLNHHLGPLRLRTLWVLLVLAGITYLCVQLSVFVNIMGCHYFQIFYTKFVNIFGCIVLFLCAIALPNFATSYLQTRIWVALYKTFHLIRNKDYMSQFADEVVVFYPLPTG